MIQSEDFVLGVVLNKHVNRTDNPHACSHPISWNPEIAGTAQLFHSSIIGYEKTSPIPSARKIAPKIITNAEVKFIMNYILYCFNSYKKY